MMYKDLKNSHKERLMLLYLLSKIVDRKWDMYNACGNVMIM